MQAAIPYLIPFAELPDGYQLPKRFTMIAKDAPHPLCLEAARELQTYLQTQQEWNHNFGLETQNHKPVIGKMFGVLVVQTTKGELGYLCAFSGKLADTNTHNRFVPPIYDALQADGFLSAGMLDLKQISTSILQLETEQANPIEIEVLKTKRKNLSVALQQQLFEQYHCLNSEGQSKSLISIFKEAGYNNPPAGAAECATPKLLQYAFQHQLKPLAVAEFWWGQSPKSEHWEHQKFYPCCKEKCEPILGWMLKRMDLEIV